MISGTYQCTWSRGRVASRLSLLRTGFAARLFREETGRRPTRLGELVPALLPRVPIDPLNDRPFVLVPTGDGLRVTSLGENGREDTGLGEGGRPDGDSESDDRSIRLGAAER